MRELKDRLKRFHLVASVRKKALEKEMLQLATVQRKHLDALLQVENAKRSYLEGIQRLNQERSSALREKLEPLEGGIDVMKQNWMNAYQKTRDLEREVQRQKQIVASAQMDCDAIDKLCLNTEQKLAAERERKEQKTLDEIATRRYNIRESS